MQRYKKLGEIALTSLKTGTFLITIKDWVGKIPTILYGNRPFRIGLFSFRPHQIILSLHREHFAVNNKKVSHFDKKVDKKTAHFDAHKPRLANAGRGFD